MLGENIVISKAEYIINKNNDFMEIYQHGIHPKIISIIFVNKNIQFLIKNITMHITAMRPIYFSKYDIKSKIILAEKKMYFLYIKKNICINNFLIIKNMLQKKISLFLFNTVFLEQIFIKNNMLMNIVLQKQTIFIKRVIIYSI